MSFINTKLKYTTELTNIAFAVSATILRTWKCFINSKFSTAVITSDLVYFCQSHLSQLY